MILANYTQQNRNCVREWGIGFTNPLAQFKPQTFLSFYVPDTLLTGLDLSGFPHGYNTEASWRLPLKTGALGGTASVTGLGTLSALGQLVKLALADLTGSGGVSSAEAEKLAALLADLTGSGGITAADLKAFLQAVADLTGSGGINSAPLTGLGALLAAIAGSGSATGSTARGLGAMSADLTVTGTGLSTANVGQAVWDTLMEAGFTAADMVRLLSAVAVGKTDIDTSGPNPIIKFRDVNDTTDRVTATMTGSERSTVDLDPT